MDPIFSQYDFASVLSLVRDAIVPYLSKLQDLPVNSTETRATFANPLPTSGIGVTNAITSLIQSGVETATRSNGPRFFNFVIGGATPAALAADWLVSVFDQNVAGKISSDYGTQVELETIRWLLELCDLPTSWGGILVPSATYANFTGLCCARQWWGERLGFNPAENGITHAPRMSVLSSGYIHPTTRKALQMLGHGRDTVQIFSSDPRGRVDLAGMQQQLATSQTPTVIIATAGEANAGDFDPLVDLADLATRFGAWLHIDAAFGIFARLSERSNAFTAGLEQANSVAADAHKWLNVPYESGFCLVRDPHVLAGAFGMTGAPYITDFSKPDAGLALLGPDASRRARALPIWATLAAYGKDGYRAMINRHINLAERLAADISDAPDFELLSEVKLPIVCFRYHPSDRTAEELDQLNTQLTEAINKDGRFSVGTTQYAGSSALRVAIFNWRTTEQEVMELFQLLQQTASEILRRNWSV